MATVTLQTAYNVWSNARKEKRFARLAFGSVVVELPWWPDEVSWSRLSQAWTELPRPGNRPLLVKESLQLPQLQIGFIATAPLGRRADYNASAWPVIKPLKAAATKGAVVYLLLGAVFATTPWRITDFGYSELDWAPDGTVSRAEVSMTLTQVSDAAMPRGPVPPKKVNP